MPRAKAKRRAALLIDCDNVSHAHLDWILEKIADEGDLRVRRAYGDFDSTGLAGWQTACETRTVQIFQATAHVKGKNASDIVLVIDAMDLLHRDESDVFYIVTNDSDFVHLAARLQTGGKTVVGIVKKESADKPFAGHCNRVLTLPAKVSKPAPAPATKKPPQPKTKTTASRADGKQSKSQARPAPKKKRPPTWIPRVVEIVRTLSENGDCPPLSTLGHRMKGSSPPINKPSEFKSLTDMLESQPRWFRVKKVPGSSQARVCLASSAREAE